jgi:hypothetical protein
VVRVAYAIAEHVEEACGDITADPDLAGRITAWADTHDALPPEVPRKQNLPVYTHREGDMLVVEVATADILDLTREGDMVVNLAHDGNPMFSFHRIGLPEVINVDRPPA